jgi:hypothetical protein
MPAKAAKPDTPTYRSIGFYDADDRNVEKVRAKLQRLDPSRRDVAITEVVRHALALAAREE